VVERNGGDAGKADVPREVAAAARVCWVGGGIGRDGAGKGALGPWVVVILVLFTIRHGRKDKVRWDVLLKHAREFCHSPAAFWGCV
jgi:hypothetical protein